MKFDRFRMLVQFLMFIFLLYGAYVGLRLSNFMPMFSCRNPAHYSSSCFLLPLQNLQYGLATISRTSVTQSPHSTVAIPDYAPFYPGGIREAAAIFLGIFFLFILIFNNLWCGWACPFGILQDWFTRLRTMIGVKQIVISQRIQKSLWYVKIMTVALFISTPVACILGISTNSPPVFCNVCPARAIMTLFQGSTLNLALAPAPGYVCSVITSILAGMVVTLVFFIKRFFCLICPVIGLAALVNKKSLLQIKKDASVCNTCGVCAKKCPVDIKEIALGKTDDGMGKDRCVQCYVCAANCPQEGALTVKFFKWKIFSFTRRDPSKR